jgi:hypothetical protein
MKKIVFLLILITLCGCAAKRAKIPKETAPKEKSELFTIYERKEDLEGFTQEELLNRLGEPYSSSESIDYDNKVTVWYYKDIYYDIKITFVNGIAYEVEYN